MWRTPRLNSRFTWRLAIIALAAAFSSFGQTGVGTFVASDGPHIAYVDESGNLSQIWYTIVTNEWGYQTLYPGAALSSSITTWTQSDGPHIAYVGTNGNLSQTWYPLASGPWQSQQLASGASLNAGVSAWLQMLGSEITPIVCVEDLRDSAHDPTRIFFAPDCLAQSQRCAMRTDPQRIESTPPRLDCNHRLRW